MDATAPPEKTEEQHPLSRKLWALLWQSAQSMQRELQPDQERRNWLHKQVPIPPLRFIGATSQPETSHSTQEQDKLHQQRATPPQSATTPWQELAQPQVEPQDHAPSQASSPRPYSAASEAQKANPPQTNTPPNPQSPQTSSAHSAMLGTPDNWEIAVRQCQNCKLGQEHSRNRRQSICGFPSMAQLAGKAIDVMVVCDAPDFQADQEDRPLSAEAFAYLQKWMAAIGLDDSFYLTNIVKCRTPGNRAPWPEETKQCLKHLAVQVEAVRPKAILALGSSPSRSLSGQRSDLNTLRYRDLQAMQIPLVVTYSVSEVLRKPQDLRPQVWDDLKKLRSILDQLN